MDTPVSAPPGPPLPVWRRAGSWLARHLIQVHTRLTTMPPGIPEVHRDIFAMTHYTYWCGLLAHCSFLVLFTLLDLPGLVIFNVASVLVYVCTLVLSRRGFLQTALFVGGLEVTLHQVYATLMLGLSSGFHFYLLILSFATLLYTHLPAAQRLAMAVAPIVLYVGLYTYGIYHPPAVALDPFPLSLLASGNLLAFTLILTGICFYFVDTAKKARIEAENLARAKTLFLANMSHELRTPLNAILGFTQIVSRSPALTPQDQGNLATIDRSGEHLLGLINSVLDMSKIEDGKLTLSETTVDLAGFLDDLTRMFTLSASRRRLEFATDIGPGLPAAVLVDEVKLRQVLINLLNNAIKFTDSGSVRLIVRGERAGTGRVRLGFAVRDTGPGLAPGELSQLFQLFTQTSAGKRAGGGTGLGLALSQRLVRLMGGNIEVESRPGAGSTFSFRVEARETESMPLRQTVRVQGLAPGQPAFRLLVVDDNEDNRNVLLQLFQRLGFAVHSAGGGEEGVRLWRELRPHLTWMDLHMPGVDGYEATRRIKELAREAGATAPVIAITASALQGERERVLALGCDDFVTKPFRVQELAALMERHLGAVFLAGTVEPVSPARASAMDWRARLQRLPETQRDSLRAAADALDPDAAERVLTAIETQDPALVVELRSLLQAYRFDTVADLLGS